MIREVDLASYLPPFMQTYQEPVVALEAENPEFAIIWNATNKVLYNRFISTADEYGISRFEQMFGIHPADEDTLESRRLRVQSKWFNAISYTWKVLLQKLTILCGDTDFTLTHNFAEGYTLTIYTSLELYGQVEELENIINSMIPCNIVIDSRNSIFGKAQGTVLVVGGLVFINDFTITNDFKETVMIDGSADCGSGIVHTTALQITQDFNEVLKVKGDALIASKIVMVDFIEIT